MMWSKVSTKLSIHFPCMSSPQHATRGPFTSESTSAPASSINERIFYRMNLLGCLSLVRATQSHFASYPSSKFSSLQLAARRKEP